MSSRTVIAGAEAIGRIAFHATVDPPFLFKSSTIASARSSLLAAICSAVSPVLLIGFPGVGKSTLLRTLAAELDAEGWPVVVWDAADTVRHFPVTPAHIREHKEHRTRSRASERRAVIFLDDAHDLSDATLNALARGAGAVLGGDCSVVFTGTPALPARIKALRDAASPLGRVQLYPLPSDDVAAYVRHRLRVAGVERPNLFTAAALDAVALLSRGVPGEINRLCATALLLAEIDGCSVVDVEPIYEAAADSGVLETRQYAAQPVDSRPGGGEPVLTLASAGGFAAFPAPDAERSDAATGRSAKQQPSRPRRRAVALAALVAMLIGGSGALLAVRNDQTAASQDTDAGSAVTATAGVTDSAVTPVPQSAAAEPSLQALTSLETVPAPPDKAPAPETPPAALVTDGEAVPAVRQSRDGQRGVDADAVTALRRGEQLLDEHDYAAARLMLRYAADRGIGRAALSLAQTYDPWLVADRFGLRADREQALHWYAIAAEQGEETARGRLVALSVAKPAAAGHSVGIATE